QRPPRVLEFLPGLLTLDRQQVPPDAQQRRRQFNQNRQPSHRPAHHDVEPLSMRPIQSRDRLGTLGQHLHVRQPQRRHGLLEKSRFLARRFDQDEPHLRHRDRQRQPRQPAARTQVSHQVGFQALQQRQQRQAVEDVLPPRL